MPSYIYISSSGTDPGAGKTLDDPLFGPVPTLGACVPNLRRYVEKGDWLFVVSGRRSKLSQYIIGGLQVEEKITALAAYERFPNYRLQRDAAGNTIGNIAIDASGNKHPLDTHSLEGFDRRVQNYLVGSRSVQLETDSEIEIGRDRTLRFLSDMKQKPANRVFDTIGRASRLSEKEVQAVLEWFDEVKQVANGQSRR